MTSNVIVDGKEYARYSGAPGGLVVRDLSDPDNPGEWQETTQDDAGMDVMVQFGILDDRREQRRRTGPSRRPTIIRRSAENVARARELGFTGTESDVSPASRSQEPNPADTLAQRLTDTGNAGTEARVSEKRFDEIHREMGIDPEEARARYRGEVD